MRIDAYNQIREIYKTSQSSKATKSEKTEGRRDQVEISQTGRDYQVAKKAVAEAPDVREDLVNSIKSKINAGTYEVSGNDFARKVIEKYNQQIL